ncbi:MAG: hypothetical protein WKG07_24590 [Hymenobacter sp.]
MPEANTSFWLGFAACSLLFLLWVMAFMGGRLRARRKPRPSGPFTPKSC